MSCNISLTKEEMLEKMISLATERHRGQTDKGGTPYILHPLTVAHLLNTVDLELKTIAIGHDLIEDTDTELDELRQMGFSSRVVAAIGCLTKDKGETFDDYRAKIKTNRDAVEVKLAELRHNTDMTRLGEITQRDFDRVKSYEMFYQELFVCKINMS